MIEWNKNSKIGAIFVVYSKSLFTKAVIIYKTAIRSLKRSEAPPQGQTSENKHW